MTTASEIAPFDAPPLAGEPVTEDSFLDGRLQLLQPLRGYRAATDPVFLAAAVDPRPGEQVLDIGCGAGAAALCLGARIAGLELHGMDVQAEYLDLARQNSARNAIELTLHEGDIAAMPKSLRALSFDHVMMNPPYHRAETIASPIDSRDRAHREGVAGLVDWIAAGLARLKPRGWLTLIHRAERAPEIMASLQGRAGSIALKPLTSRTGRDAGRIIIQARKGARAPFRLLSPLVLHKGVTHLRDGDDFTDEARAILRAGAALQMAES